MLYIRTNIYRWSKLWKSLLSAHYTVDVIIHVETLNQLHFKIFQCIESLD